MVKGEKFQQLNKDYLNLRRLRSECFWFVHAYEFPFMPACVPSWALKKRHMNMEWKEKPLFVPLGNKTTCLPWKGILIQLYFTIFSQLIIQKPVQRFKQKENKWSAASICLLNGNDCEASPFKKKFTPGSLELVTSACLQHPCMAKIHDSFSAEASFNWQYFVATTEK